MTEKRTDGVEEERERENSAGKLGMHSLIAEVSHVNTASNVSTDCSTEIHLSLFLSNYTQVISTLKAVRAPLGFSTEGSARISLCYIRLRLRKLKEKKSLEEACIIKCDH